MVVLSISPYRGNHQRFFPHAGFLGLTPVVVQGTLRTVLEEDHKPLKASSVCVRVRCYEADTSGASKKGKKVGSGIHVLFDAVQELWTREEGEEWGSLGDFSTPFRIVIPVGATGVTTATYKNYRTWWQIEAVIHHKATSVDGCRRLVAHQLPLTRYTQARPSSLPPPSWNSLPCSRTLASDRGLHYSVSTKSLVYGPSDPIDISFSFRREDPALQIRKIQISLDRHLILQSSDCSLNSDIDDVFVPEDQPICSPFTSTLEPDHCQRLAKPNAKGLTSVFGKKSSSIHPQSPVFITMPSPSSSSPLSTSTKSLSCSSVLFGKGSLSNTILVFESDDGSIDDLQDGHTLVLNGIVPKPKSLYRYSMGETMRTKFAHMHFSLNVKIFIKTKRGGSEVIELEPREVMITGVSDADRSKALLEAGRILAVADAETRLFDPTANIHSSPPSEYNFDNFPDRPTSLDFRNIASWRDNAQHSPIACADQSAMQVNYNYGRRRSDQSDGMEAPVKSRARMTPSTSTPDLSLTIPAPTSAYIPSALSQPPLYRAPSSGAPSLVSVQHRNPAVLPSSASYYSNTSSTKNLGSTSESYRQARRAARSANPYPTAASMAQPRNVAFSIASTRSSSTRSSRPASAAPSVTSNNSGARFTREQSAPLQSIASATGDMLEPLSLYSNSTSPTSVDPISTRSLRPKAPSRRPSTAPHYTTAPPRFSNPFALPVFDTTAEPLSTSSDSSSQPDNDSSPPSSVNLSPCPERAPVLSMATGRSPSSSRGKKSGFGSEGHKESGLWGFLKRGKA